MKKNLNLLFVLCFLLCYASPAIFACELPAEPSAALVPVNGQDGVEMVTEGGNTYFLVPQGKEVQMRVAWDPATHVNGVVTNKAKYDGIIKKTAFRPSGDLPVIGGCGYFPIGGMAEFFGVKGNRSSPAEAFSRMAGFSLPSNGMFYDPFGPYHWMSQFAKPGQKQSLSILDERASGYEGDGVSEVQLLDDVKVTEAINDALPSSDRNTTSIDVDGESTMVEITSDPKVAVRITGGGVYLDDLKLTISGIDYTDFKAYELNDGSMASAVKMSGIKLLTKANGSDGDNGDPNGNLTVTFNAPTIYGNDLGNSMKKIKVYAPSAGFLFKNLFWCWNEQKYKLVTVPATSKQKVDADGNPVVDADGNPVMEEDVPEHEEWQVDGGVLKCSRALELIVSKPSRDNGFTGFVVYDTSPPVSSKLEITNADGSALTEAYKFSTTGSTDVYFKMTVLDSNPFAPKDSTLIDEHYIKNDADTIGLQMFYCYPYYNFSTESGKKIDDLKAGYGLADFTTAESGDEDFKTMKYKPQWVWKKVTPTDVTITPGTTISDVRLVGSTFIVKGKMKVEINPWHSCNGASNSNGNTVGLNDQAFKIFGICKDTSGHENTWYSTVNGKTYPLKKDESQGDGDYACMPALSGSTPIPANTGDPSFNWLTGTIQKTNWQKQAFIKSQDIIAPEIEVFVFDTRTNKFHVFGTKKNMDAEFTDFGNNSPGGDPTYDYGSVTNFPYVGHETDSIDFTNIEESLFDKYFQSDKGVSTVSNESSDGYVCQKNTRLVFYIRAFDNINTFEASKNGGVSLCEYDITDKSGAISSGDTGGVITNKMLEPVHHQFRYPNMAGDYKLHVHAKDYSGNERDFTLKIGVTGRELGIRTLEERRNREN